MKKRAILICSAVAAAIGVMAFVVVNRSVILQNFFVALGSAAIVGDLEGSEVYPFECGDYRFEFVLSRTDNYLIQYKGSGQGDPDTPRILEKIYKYVFKDRDLYLISEYGYAYINKHGTSYICLNDKADGIERFEISDLVYLSSFEDFTEEQQENLKYLDKKIIFKDGAYSIWN